MILVHSSFSKLKNQYKLLYGKGMALTKQQITFSLNFLDQNAVSQHIFSIYPMPLGPKLEPYTYYFICMPQPQIFEVLTHRTDDKIKHSLIESNATVPTCTSYATILISRG